MLVLGELANQDVEGGLDRRRGLTTQLDDASGLVRFFFVACQLGRPQIHHAFPHFLKFSAFLRSGWVRGYSVGAGALAAAVAAAVAAPPVLPVLLALELLLVLIGRWNGRRHDHMNGRPRMFAWHGSLWL